MRARALRASTRFIVTAVFAQSTGSEQSIFLIDPRDPASICGSVLIIKSADTAGRGTDPMLKNDPELLIKILDDYSSGATHSLEMLAKRNFISTRTLFLWMRDKDIIVPEYMGRQNITFGAAMALARNVAKVIIVSRTLEAYVAEGRRVEVWHHGEPSYEDDEAAVLEEDLELREMLFGYRDGKKRDANGNRIVRTRIEFAPAALIEKYASANMPQIYGQKSEVTMKGNVSLGVTTIGQRAPLPPQVQAMLPGAIGPMGAGEITETVRVPQIAPTTDTPEVFEAEANLDAPVTAPEPERVIRDLPGVREKIAPPTKPVGFNEIPARQPRSEMERDLFARLASAREKAAQ
jgi:hypothetical protein